MRQKPLDEVDGALLQRTSENPGACIGEIIRPFLNTRSETVLRQRIRGLDLRGLIRSQRTKKEVLLYTVEEE
jgi:predicted transcriptional regulator